MCIQIRIIQVRIFDTSVIYRHVDNNVIGAKIKRALYEYL